MTAGWGYGPFGFGAVGLADLFEGLRVPFPAMAVFDSIEKYHLITPEHFASKLHGDCYGQLTAKNLLSEKPTMRRVDSSGGAFVPSPSSYAMTQTASRAERRVRRATDGPELGDNFDSSP